MAYSWLRTRHLKCALALVGLVAGAAGATACGDESGVLVEVTRDPETTPAEIDSLEFVIGLDDGTGRYTRDEGSSIESVSISGRDLVSAPYQLLLRNGTGKDGAKVTVAVMAYRAGQMVGFAGFDQAQPFKSGQVLMRQLVLSGEPDVVVTDTGCVIWGVDASRVVIASPGDEDCDGDPASSDCNDADPTVGPSQTEQCGNMRDDNCNEMIDEETDTDGDQITNCAGDCDDNDPNTHPGATEICDAKDNDCNTRCDDGKLDADQDDYNTCGEKIKSDGTCVDAEPDCDDGDDTVNPGAEEQCDGKDNNCDGTCDVSGELDVDMDGYTECGTVPGVCGPPLGQLADCNDGNGEVHPFADEICDGFDTDCDGTRLGHAPCYGNENGAIECRVGTRNCDDDNADGTSGFTDECVVSDGSDLARAPLCPAYTSCDQQGVPDPFACAGNAAATGKIVCNLAFTEQGLCPERVFQLPSPPMASGCTWSILGGTDLDHYKVGVLVPMGSPSQTAQSCQAAFTVVASLDLVPQFQNVYLSFIADQVQQAAAVRLEIVPMKANNCPMNGGLQCTIVNNPFP
jgi:hypothetical protein